MMGVELMENFQRPYLAVSMTDFWRRWHISLTGWFREYVYIPLGGNRKGPAKQMLFTGAVFLLSGLWHGANWTFVVWGAIHGGYLCMEKLWQRVKGASDTVHINGWCLKALLWMKTLVLACFAWVFFRADTMVDALYVLRHSLTGLSHPLQYCKAAAYSLSQGTINAAILLFSFFLLMSFDGVNEKQDTILVISKWPAWLRWSVYIGFLLVLIALIPKRSTAPFLYFQF